MTDATTPAMRVVRSDEVCAVSNALTRQHITHFITVWVHTRDAWAVYVNSNDEPALANAIHEVTP
jgi:hypothetical protein